MTSIDYYAGIRRQYGFADSTYRGHGYDAVRIAPVAPVQRPPGQPTSFCTTPASEADLEGTRRDRAVDFDIAMRQRDREVSELLADLRALVGHVKLRVNRRAGAAARDALTDAVEIVAGRHPLLARGDRLEMLRSLVRILKRYA